MQHLLKDVQQRESEDTDNTSRGSEGQLADYPAEKIPFCFWDKPCNWYTCHLGLSHSPVSARAREVDTNSELRQLAAPGVVKPLVTDAGITRLLPTSVEP